MKFFHASYTLKRTFILPLRKCKSFTTMTTSQNEKIDLSLDRIKRILSHLGSPQNNFPIIHIAGTNAKGSTVQYLRSILQNVIGVRTGTFTTPHLIEERDSCQVNGQVIDLNVWENAGEIVRKADNISQQNSTTSISLCTPFEFLTARCFVAFNLLSGNQRPEVLVIEVGMGGSLDATNVFNEKQVLASVITSIDFDHQSLLGNTLTEISSQKAGIIKENGLCIIADQRRNVEMFNETEIDCTKIITKSKETIKSESDEILESIRSIAHERNARLVKSFIPWKVLHEAQANETITWNTSIFSNVRFCPTLSPSRIQMGQYIAKTGDNIVAGPKLQLKATRASLMGSHSALQTLWSIARDESPCGLGIDGSDEYEELRLRIAFALRDEAQAKQLIERCISSTQLAGRADWMKIRLPKLNQSDQMFDEERENQSIFALVDGAHNPSALIALRQYVKTCIQSHSSSFRQDTIVTLTWILAFSQGKPIEEMAKIILSDMVNSDEEIQNRVALLNLNENSKVSSKIQVQHRIACVPFTTPVEGMPWVQSMPIEEINSHFQNKANVVETKTFDNLNSALIWSSEKGDGNSIGSETPNMIIIAGSLYLVSDVHRFNTIN